MRKGCVQFQPDRVTAQESLVRQAFRDAFPNAVIDMGNDGGRYENILFEAESPEDALLKLRAVFDSPDAGLAARRSCIVTCEGERGWDDYVLLHHYDRTLIVDTPQ